MVHEEVQNFVASLGGRHNASNPVIAGILLEPLGDRAGPDDNERVLATLSAMRRNARVSNLVIQLIDSQIRERISQLTDTNVADRLREAIQAQRIPAVEEEDSADYL